MGETAGVPRFLLITASLVVIIAGLRAAASLLLPLVLALFLAMLSLPMLVWLHERKIPTVVAVFLAVFTNIAVLAGVVFVVSGSVTSFTEQAPKYADRLQQMAGRLFDWLQARGVEVSPLRSRDFMNPGAVIALVGQLINGVTAVLSNTLLVVLTMIFFLFEIAQLPEKLHLALGGREGKVEYFTRITREVQGYLGVKTLTSLATGIVIGAWVAVLGVDFPMLWGLIAFLFNYVPTLGSILAAVPPLLLTVVQFGPGQAILVGLGYVAVNIVVGYFIEPYLMGRTLGLSTLVIFLSLVIWGWIWGPVGMLLSVPLTMSVKIMLENTKDFRWLAVLLAADPAEERRSIFPST